MAMELYLQNFSNGHTSNSKFHSLNKGVGSTEMNKDTYPLVFPQFRVHMKKKKTSIIRNTKFYKLNCKRSLGLQARYYKYHSCDLFTF